jgi:SAM-dependent methyltransferase
VPRVTALRQRVGRGLLRARLATTTIDPIRSREVRPMLRRLSLAPGDAVLDVGCAAGVWAHHVARRVARSAGVDVDGPTVALGARLHPDVELREADARDLPFADGEFDKVLFISTLEHIDDPAAALAEVTRVLRPGGLMGLSVDTLDHPAWAPLRELHARRSFVVQYFTRERLHELAGACGLELVWGRYLYGHRLAPRLLRLRLTPSNRHWLVAPAVRLAGLLDDADAGMIYQSVWRKPLDQPSPVAASSSSDARLQPRA